MVWGEPDSLTFQNSWAPGEPGLRWQSPSPSPKQLHQFIPPAAQLLPCPTLYMMWEELGYPSEINPPRCNKYPTFLVITRQILKTTLVSHHSYPNLGLEILFRLQWHIFWFFNQYHHASLVFHSKTKLWYTQFLPFWKQCSVTDPLETAA